MKRFCVLFLLLVLSLCAADFWQSRPFTEWSDKEVQKMMTNSPWARPISLSMGGGAPAPPVLGRGGGGDTSPGDSGAPPPISEGGGRGGRGGGGFDAGVGTALPAINAVVRWQTALPVKQVVTRIRYGSEVATSAEAKKFLDREETSYIICVSGLPATTIMGDEEKVKDALKGQASLTVKGKDKIQPSDVQLSRGKGVDIYFIFPKTAPFTLDDKEVEFSSKVGAVSVKCKFRLKDMVFNGKLAL
jgi:hypothetical protein